MATRFFLMLVAYISVFLKNALEDVRNAFLIFSTRGLDGV